MSAGGLSRGHSPAAWLLAGMLLPPPVWAHTQPGSVAGFLAGLLHPVSGLDYVLAMVAVGLWGAKYVDLTHTMTPTTPLWAGFGPSTFGRTIDPKTGKPYNK